MPHAEYCPAPGDAEKFLRPRLDSDLMIPAEGMIEADRQPPPTDGGEDKPAAE